MPKLREFTDQYDVVYVTPGGAAHLYESCWKNDNGLEKNTDVLFQDKEVCGYCAKRSSRVYR